ncbi:M20 family metallopeptidase [Granulicella arctica]|uniref:Glutamate carboxypeptidase n=1 Tax=Granulicella arctica TaxID=940613 RepID=A0A7Y9TJY6_9BACT|nr:M20 family metallopeptidase [Granulicella arctica]NYF78762.1 glutamate carboxypeptidase [Granulicella arctica]
MDVHAITTAVAAKSSWINETLRKLVLIESPTEDSASVNAAMSFAAGVVRELGGRVKLHKQKHFGHVNEIRFGPVRSTKKPILLLGHLDTVWPLGTLKTMPWQQKNGRFYGPGVLDMKAGVVMALAAVSVLRDLGLSRPVTLLLNSEEEVGSPISRPITEKLALKSAAVFVLEPAQGLAYKTARKGIGHYTLRVDGVAAHSGVDFERGHSAILEMAKLVQTVSGFTDLAKKRTVNCGVITGGTRSNVIAAACTVEVDVRVFTARDGQVVDRLFRRLKPSDPHCKLTVTGGLNRPPMERKAGTIALFQQVRKLAEQIGFQLDEAATGGGSDGNFTAALGIPTLDGMGAVGEGAHAPHESILIEHLIPRTALLAAMIAAT